MTVLDHERLDVYKTALELVAINDEIVSGLPKGRAYLTDQLQRASISVLLNIAEGAGEFSRKEKARFYRMALRSATECGAIIDACCRLRIAEETEVATGRQLLVRVVSMLTAMVRSLRGARNRERGRGRERERDVR